MRHFTIHIREFIHFFSRQRSANILYVHTFLSPWHWLHFDIFFEISTDFTNSGRRSELHYARYSNLHSWGFAVLWHKLFATITKQTDLNSNRNATRLRCMGWHKCLDGYMGQLFALAVLVSLNLLDREWILRHVQNRTQSQDWRVPTRWGCCEWIAAS